MFCEQCGTPLKPLGKETVREELEYIPAQLRIVRYVRWTYECPKCKHTDKRFIKKAPAPTSLMNHSLASPSSVAQVMYQKYVNSVPLYRQEKEWEQLGISFKPGNYGELDYPLRRGLPDPWLRNISVNCSLSGISSTVTRHRCKS